MLFALGFLAAGCGGRAKDLERGIALLDSKVALDDQVVLVDTEGHRAFMLDVAGQKLEADATEVPLPVGPIAAVRRSGAHNEALILCKGQRASESEAPEPAELAALGSDGKVRHYKLDSPFDTLVQSDDGTYAFLFKKEDAQRLLENPNEIAILDLDQDPAQKDNAAVTFRTLRAFSDSPLAVIFSPTMHIVNEDRRLAVVLSKTNVTLIDLAHLDRRETTVQLSDPSGMLAVEPTQVMFNPDTPDIYVRGVSSSDVFVFNLTERPADDLMAGEREPHNDFRPSIDQLGVSGRPTDMALYQGDTGTRLLVLAADTQQASVIDASTSQVTSVKLPAPAGQILMFDATSPRDDQLKKRALLYQNGSSSLMFLDLAELETRGTRNLEQVTLSQPIFKLIPMLEERQALVIHQSGGVSLVDLAGRTVSPIRSNAMLTDALFDPERHKLWVAPNGQNFVGLLDLTNGNTEEVLLDAEVQTLIPMFKRGRVVVLHESAVGYATVLSASAPKRETAQSVRGFLIAGSLDRGR
jgi:DNA-binding beta-propeller fold protein YncE